MTSRPLTMVAVVRETPGQSTRQADVVVVNSHRNNVIPRGTLGEPMRVVRNGAGRAKSRDEAKRPATLADHAAATAGVECRNDEDVIDEKPAGYKSIEAVMEARRDLVEVVHTLNQVVCVKG